MRIGSFVMALVGVAIAGGSVFAAREYLNIEARATVEGNPQIVRVLAASRDIPFGHVIDNSMLTTIEWPVESVPSGVFTDRNQVLPTAGIEPRRAKFALAQGELILQSKLSEFGEKVTIVQTLGENTRAMAVKVDAETGVGGFVTPGDFVDVVLTQGRHPDLRAVTILQNIRVVGVDQKSDARMDEPGVARTVTVEVSPVQGQRLALAQKAGTLSLTLRTLDGAVDSPMESVRLSDLLSDKAPVEDEGPKPVIRVRRGADAVEEVAIN